MMVTGLYQPDFTSAITMSEINPYLFYLHLSLFISATRMYLQSMIYYVASSFFGRQELILQYTVASLDSIIENILTYDFVDICFMSLSAHGIQFKIIKCTKPILETVLNMKPQVEKARKVQMITK